MDATSPPRALTDARLAALTGLAERDVIDAARELLALGFLCLADARGRWLGTVAEARVYERSLRGRALGVLQRRRLLRAAIRRAELAAAVTDQGQFTLFPEAAR